MGGGGKGGSDPSQAGTAITPGQQYAQQQFAPLLQQQALAAMGGQKLYPTVDAGSTGYTAQGYNSPQMPFSSPMDYLQKGEIDTTRNLIEQFGQGSARGGPTQSGYDYEANLFGQLGQGAMGRYMNALLPYSQMEAQASQFGAGAQNQARQFGAGAQNQASMFNTSNRNQAYAAPWNYQSMYANTTGNAMVNPGQQGKGMGDMLLGGALGSSMLGFSPFAAGAAAPVGAELGLLAMASDIRLKKNVKKIGKHKGMDVIEFEYLWGGGRKVGLIAQQVRDVMPHAVGVQNGYLYVNYALV